MTAKFFDLVQVGITSAGTGTTVNLAASAPTGYLTPAAAGVGAGDTLSYVIRDGAAWEIGRGSVSAGVLSRTIVQASSAAGARISLSGSAVMMLTASSFELNELANFLNQVVRIDASQSLTITQMLQGRQNSGSLGSGVRVVSSGTTDTLGVTDIGKLIRYTGASAVTVSFAAAATLGAGWSCQVRAEGAGGIVLDPSGSETIDGALTLSLAAGQSVTLICDGTAIYSVGSLASSSLPTVASFTSVLAVDIAIPATGDEFELDVFEFMNGGAGSGGYAAYRVATNGVPTFITAASSYYSLQQGVSQASGTVNNSSTTDKMDYAAPIGGTGGVGAGFLRTTFSPGSATRYPVFSTEAYGPYTTTWVRSMAGGMYRTTARITHVRLFSVDGTTTMSGKYTLRRRS